MPKNSNHQPTRQEKRSQRQANARKMRVHGRGMKRNLATKGASKKK